MSYLIAAVMVILLGALGFRWIRGEGGVWLLAAASVLAGVPILLALLRTVPNAVALGNRVGTPTEQSRLARAICLDHVVCLVFMSAFLAIWMTFVAVGTS
jgi:cobalamin synthase